MSVETNEAAGAKEGGGRAEVGCQGWNYDDWVTPHAGAASVFYPRSTRAARMLELYARAFQTVEVDSTFYAVPTASTVEAWRGRTPRGFTFSLKLPQLVTHRLALRGASGEALAQFCDRARLLKEKLASVLVQLPPQFEATPENSRALAEFLALAPRDVRFAVEFRDAGWYDEGTIQMLNRRGAAPALVEGPWVARERAWRASEMSQVGFAYVRWMGERDLARFDRVARPREENLRAWAEIIERLRARGLATYAYFSNFYEGHAPASANRLRRLLGQPITAPEELESQPSLF